MPRVFVNSIANFIIQGGMVSFTLQDQKMRTENGKPVAAPPEDIADVVMREAEFAQLLCFLNQHATAFEQQAGRKLGGAGGAPGDAPATADPGDKRGGGMKIRPRSG